MFLLRSHPQHRRRQALALFEAERCFFEWFWTFYKCRCEDNGQSKRAHLGGRYEMGKVVEEMGKKSENDALR